jgi:hypothetical protein
MANAASPAVLKTADFPGVSPDNLVIAVAEKRRVKIDKVCALRFQGFEDFKIVPKDKAVNGHALPLFLVLFLARTRQFENIQRLKGQTIQFAQFLSIALHFVLASNI